MTRNGGVHVDNHSYSQKASENAQGEHIWVSLEDDQAGRGGLLSKDSNIARHDKDGALKVKWVTS